MTGIGNITHLGPKRFKEFTGAEQHAVTVPRIPRSGSPPSSGRCWRNPRLVRDQPFRMKGLACAS
jgi:hypothetical protein